MSFTDKQIEEMAESAWRSLEGFSEVNYILEPSPYRDKNGEDPYKPFYRTATIFVQMSPPQFKVLGLRRHLTAQEALQVARAMHPYMERHLASDKGQDHFLRLFHDFAEMYDPEEWG